MRKKVVKLRSFRGQAVNVVGIALFEKGYEYKTFPYGVYDCIDAAISGKEEAEENGITNLVLVPIRIKSTDYYFSR